MAKGRVIERGGEGAGARGSFRVIPFHSHSKLKARYTDHDQKGYDHALPSPLLLALARFLGFEVIANLETTLARNHNYAAVGHSNE